MPAGDGIEPAPGSPPFTPDPRVFSLRDVLVILTKRILTLIPSARTNRFTPENRPLGTQAATGPGDRTVRLRRVCLF